MITGSGGEVERPVAVAKCDVNAGIAEADDIGPPKASHIGQNTRMFVHAPAARFLSKVRKHDRRRAERAMTVTARGPYAGVVEPNDVRAIIAVMSTTARGLRSTRQRAEFGPIAIEVAQKPPLAPGTPY